MEGPIEVWIGSGTEDCASAPSHTTGHTVFGIRRLKSSPFLGKIRWQKKPVAAKGGLVEGLLEHAMASHPPGPSTAVGRPRMGGLDAQP